MGNPNISWVFRDVLAWIFHYSMALYKNCFAYSLHKCNQDPGIWIYRYLLGSLELIADEIYFIWIKSGTLDFGTNGQEWRSGVTRIEYYVSNRLITKVNRKRRAIGAASTRSETSIGLKSCLSSLIVRRSGRSNLSMIYVVALYGTQTVPIEISNRMVEGSAIGRIMKTCIFSFEISY